MRFRHRQRPERNTPRFETAPPPELPEVNLPPWTLPGLVNVVESARHYPEHSAAIVRLKASLATAGSSTTTVAIKVDGVTVTTIDLLSGERFKEEVVDIIVTEGSYLTMRVTSAGSGAHDLEVQVN